jgi:restriction system protein
MGGEGAAREVMRKVADIVVTDPEARQKQYKDGENAAENEVAWSRNDLRELAFLESRVHGIWTLIPEGWNATPSPEEATEWNHRVSAIRAAKKKLKQESAAQQDYSGATDEESEAEPLADDLLTVMRNLPPTGFERLCQRILRAVGFKDVEVTKRSGDGGIDGLGVLQVNEFVAFPVLFQCKRYADAVGAGAMRDFRGAMMGRTDKGIFLTTGSFTREAVNEANRAGVPPIELVDADRLVEIMERHSLGVKPRTVYDVDHEWFAPFQSTT